MHRVTLPSILQSMTWVIALPRLLKSLPFDFRFSQSLPMCVTLSSILHPVTFAPRVFLNLRSVASPRRHAVVHPAVPDFRFQVQTVLARWHAAAQSMTWSCPLVPACRPCGSSLPRLRLPLPLVLRPDAARGLRRALRHTCAPSVCGAHRLRPIFSGEPSSLPTV